MRAFLALLLLVPPTTLAFVPISPLAPHTALSRLSSSKADEKVQKTDPSVANAKNPETEPRDKRYCIPLEEICLDDLPKVGGKTASLGEMIQQLAPLGVDVPGGFGVSSTVYDAVLDRYNLRERLQRLLKDIDGENRLQARDVPYRGSHRTTNVLVFSLIRYYSFESRRSCEARPPSPPHDR